VSTTPATPDRATTPFSGDLWTAVGLLAPTSGVLATLSLALLVATMIARGPTDFSVAPVIAVLRDGEDRAIWRSASTAPPSNLQPNQLHPSRSLPTGSISSGPAQARRPPASLVYCPIDAQADRDNFGKMPVYWPPVAHSRSL